MYLEHINLVVKDLDETLVFYKAAFPSWSIRSRGNSPWHEYERTWIHFGDDYHYLALSDHGVGENRDLAGNQVGLAHFAYVTNNLDAVIQRLANAGFEPAKPGAKNKYRRNIYFIDPNGYEIEFVEYLSDLPSERNNDD